MVRRKKLLSIIVPTFNEEENIEYAYREIRKVMGKMEKYNWELIFADNDSDDDSRQILRKISAKDKRVTALFLSRNFTSEYSSHAGMKQALGDAITILDCDLQDHPSELPRMLSKWEAGYPVVVGIHNVIRDGLLMKMVRRSFYVLFKKMANIDLPLNAGTFCVLDRKVMDHVLSLPEGAFSGLRAWVGFKTAYVEYERRERFFGRSKNSLLDYLRDAQRGLLGFSFVPLDIMSSFGFFLTFASFLFVAIYLSWSILFGNPINASIPIILSVFGFGGLQMLGLSILGKYIQIILEEVKDRPTFLIERIINDHRKRPIA